MRRLTGDFINYLRNSETDRGRLGATFESPGSEVSLVGQGPAGGAMAIDRSALRESPGFQSAPVRLQQDPTYKMWFDEARRIVDNALTGNRRAMFHLQEAMTTADFPLLFGDVLDRSVLANYAETPYTWNMYCYRKVLNDLRLARMFRVDRGASVLDGPLIPNSSGASGSGPTGLEQLSEYPLRKRVVSGYTDQLYKFGCRMDFSFETIVNDDLDALKDTPALFGRAARRTEEKRATKLFASSTGPNSSFFSNANKNLINATVIPNYTGSPNPSFSADALKWALVVLSNQRDLDGEPISIEGAVLVYPPALHVDVQNVLNARTLWTNIEGGSIFQNVALNAATSGMRLEVANWASKIVTPALNYYLPIVDTTSGNQAWYVFADPNKGRPALQQSFLRGREAPQLFMKLPNQVAIGEGRMGPGAGTMPGTMMTNPMEGDYENDAIDYKIRHFLGGTLLDPIMAVASSGANA